MSKKQKLLKHALSGSKNMSFGDLTLLVEAFGFTLARINGSHHIFTHPQIPDFVNLQNVKGKAKPYQVKQFLSLVEQHNLILED